MQFDSLYIQKDSLENKLREIEIEASKQSFTPIRKKKWYNRIWPFDN